MTASIILLLLSKNNIDTDVRLIIVIVVIIIIIIIGTINKAGSNSTSNHYSKTSYTSTAPVRDPNLWYGEMGCYNCGYRWQARKNTPPASCPSCRSKNISIITGNKPFVRHKPQRQSYSPPELPEPAINSQNPYEVLQVPLSASIEEISAAYKRMAQMYHPDKVASLAPEFREVAERRMKEINIAFAALKTQGQTQAILPSDTRSDKRTEQPSSIRSRAKAALETYTAKVVQMDSEGVSKSENTMDADVAKISKAAEIRRSTSANKPEIGDKATENQIKKVPLSEQRGESAGEQDELYDEALAIVTDMDRASTSVLQRRLSVGYGRAAKILDTMEREGFISPADGAKPRKVLPTAYEFRDRVEQNLSEAAKDK